MNIISCAQALAAGSDGGLTLIDVQHGGTILHKVDAHSGSIQALSFVPLFGEDSTVDREEFPGNTPESDLTVQNLEAATQPEGGQERKPDGESIGDLLTTASSLKGTHRPVLTTLSSRPAEYDDRDPKGDPKAVLVVTSGEDGFVKVWSYGTWTSDVGSAEAGSEAAGRRAEAGGTSSSTPPAAYDMEAWLSRPPSLVRRH